MRILAFTDIHGALHRVEAILGREQSFDVVVLGGDISTYGTAADAEEAVRRVRTFGRPVLAVTGNMDPLQLDAALIRLGASIDGRGVVVDDVGFFGVSAAPLSVLHSPNEISEDEIRRRAEAGWKDVHAARWKVFVSHAPPRGTALDRTMFRSHVGSSAVREFMERHRPDVTVCGHIHEARGTDTVEGVQAINCGPAGRGYYGVITIGETITLENRG